MERSHKVAKKWRKWPLESCENSNQGKEGTHERLEVAKGQWEGVDISKREKSNEN